MCRARGIENKYTEKFDEIYGKYSIDIIDELKKARNDNPDIPLDDSGDLDGVK